MMRNRRKYCRGFTLVEMAMVMVVMGLIMLTVFPALSVMRSANARALTQANLNTLMQATAAYVQANGCLPCPMPASTTFGGFGRVRGDTSSAPSPCGTCPAAAIEGIPPYVSLGLPASVAHDGYNHWISMRVDPALTAAFGIAPPTAPCSCSQSGSTCTASSAACSCTLVNSVCTPVVANQSIQGMCQKNLSKTSTVQVIVPGGSAQNAAVVFISYGAEGYGSFLANVTPIAGGNGTRVGFPTTYFACAANCLGGFARCNAAGSGTFCDAPLTVDNTGVAAYDDMIVLADRNTLVSRFGNGSCQTVW